MIVPDNDEFKRVQAKIEYPLLGYSYEKPKDPVFRDTNPATCLKLNQSDFNLKTIMKNTRELPEA